MDSFRVELKRTAEKELAKLPKTTAARVVKQISFLSNEPFTAQAAKLQAAERLYRLRVGNYRVIYEVVSEARLVIVHYIRHRRDAYRK